MIIIKVLSHLLHLQYIWILIVPIVTPMLRVLLCYLLKIAIECRLSNSTNRVLLSVQLEVWNLESVDLDLDFRFDFED